MPETRGLPLYFLLLPRTLPTPPSPSFTVFPLPPHYFPSTTTVNTSTKFLLSLSSHYSHYFYYFLSTIPLFNCFPSTTTSTTTTTNATKFLLSSSRICIVFPPLQHHHHITIVVSLHHHHNSIIFPPPPIYQPLSPSSSSCFSLL